MNYVILVWTFHVRSHPEICTFCVRDYLHETAAAAAAATTTITTTTTTTTTKGKVIPLQARCGPEGG